ncbi:MAG TPA: xanthine dehydrogenase family protein subunit M [Pyrinomonadaceae bacterium]|nr:xanthine dehydrogenase family protein subunit M [Pyrinomonadaceae bacterium]HMP66641.1 xanthine dehydrogenase family protein subunit M [Pyrinomonadaceae bacterium]
MRPFAFKRVADTTSAVELVAKNRNARFIAGGTNLIDLMKESVDRPNELVDISRLPLRVVRSTATGVAIGALAKNTDTANHPLIKKEFPLLTQAILAGASPQIRNMATNGGNLMQRTRCHYFYDLGTPCNKRQSGSGCGAKDGLNRYSAIFGWSDSCVAVHPSDMCVALAALDAVVNVQTPDGAERKIKFTDFHRLPGDLPELDNNLSHGELITTIEIPRNNFAANSYYLKVRDRASYAFALVSVAAALEIEKGEIKQARIALGGVAHKPWRCLDAEKMLVGKKPDAAVFRQAAELALKDARPLSDNKYKVKMAQRAIAKALGRAARV